MQTSNVQKIVHIRHRIKRQKAFSKNCKQEEQHGKASEVIKGILHFFWK